MIGKYIDGDARQRGARRGGVSPRARAQPAPVGGAQVLRQPGSGHRPGAASARAPARRGQPSRQRSGAVRRARPRLPLLRPLRRVDRRARRGAPARSERPHEPRADAADDGRHRTAPGRRAAAGLSPAATRASGSSAWAWPDVATRRARRCSRCARRRRIPAFQSWTEYLMAWLDRRPADMLVGLAALSALKIQDDPEAIFQEGWLLCDVGEHEEGLVHLRRGVAKGYFVAPTLSAAARSTRCGAIRAFRRCWRKRKRAASRRWPRSARRAESDFSDRDATARRTLRHDVACNTSPAPLASRPACTTARKRRASRRRVDSSRAPTESPAARRAATRDSSG